MERVNVSLPRTFLDPSFSLSVATELLVKNALKMSRVGVNVLTMHLIMAIVAILNAKGFPTSQLPPCFTDERAFVSDMGLAKAAMDWTLVHLSNGTTLPGVADLGGVLGAIFARSATLDIKGEGSSCESLG